MLFLKTNPSLSDSRVYRSQDPFRGIRHEKGAPVAATSQEMKETNSYMHTADVLVMQLSASLPGLADLS